MHSLWRWIPRYSYRSEVRVYTPRTKESTRTVKPTVVMIRVVTKPEYRDSEQGLLDSYRRFDAGCPHDLVIIDRRGDSPHDVPSAKHLRYDDQGWDCGAWQFAGWKIPSADLLVCLNSSTYITGDGWLKRFVDTAKAHGDGLYGPMASYEINPHIRTPCMVFQPHIIRHYPAQVIDREDTYRFEVFGFNGVCPNFTLWVRAKGWQTRLVTWDGDYDLPDWRKPDNIFRRGDQSNLIVRDRHAKYYEDSDADNKKVLERLADDIK